MPPPRQEPAIRSRLDGSTDAVIARSGVHLLRGRETFFLSDRAVDALVADWTSRRDWLEALRAALAGETGRPTDEPSPSPGGRERP